MFELIVLFAQRNRNDISLLWILFGVLGVILLFFAACAIYGFTRGLLQARGSENETVKDYLARIRIAGAPRVGLMVMANSKLFSPGNEDLPCLLLFPNKARITRIEKQQIEHLANELMRLKYEDPTTELETELAQQTRDEQSSLGSFDTLPASVTNGMTLHTASLIIERDRLPTGVLEDRWLSISVVDRPDVQMVALERPLNDSEVVS